jgi:eukaryotic-like serine/threonine-protein kinase
MNKELPANTTLSHYRIVSKIGAGGMGEVYLAQDTKLDRKVAIKFLHEEFSKDADKLGRFIQEAKAASALNHPNILTVYEIGEVDGKNYIATELIEGKTLREHLSHKESLQLNVILKIGVQVSEALAAAHQAGIVHRDVKPENIMLRKDGYAKVLDFGLAKLTEKKTTDEVSTEGETRVFVKTTPGMVMGTVSYMSPEQARGTETDARTDIWSLGVVLYEMLAAKVPFTGETVNHTIVSILEKEPLLLEDVPAELQRIVRKSLTKDVEMRYQTAHDLLIDLKNLRRDLDIQGELERSIIPNRETPSASLESATQVHTTDPVATTRSGQTSVTQNISTSSSSLEYAVTQAKSHKLATAIIGVLLVGLIVGYFAFASGGGGAKQINSIAVLPFANASGDKDTEFLSDGISETLINNFTKIPELKVTARSTAFRFRGREGEPQAIGRELGVGSILTGKLLQRGENLSIQVDLVNTTNGLQIWGDRYEGKTSEIVSIQQRIATDVSSQLKLKLTGAQAQQIAKTYTQNAEAYQHYLRGRYYWNKRTADDLTKAIHEFQQAAESDPNYALAYVGLADCHVVLEEYAGTPSGESLPQARAFAQKALRIDDSLGEAHATLGVINDNSWQWAEGEKEYRRAIELNPNYPTVHHWYNINLRETGRLDEAMSEIKRAQELDPLSGIIGANVGIIYAVKGDLRSAVESLKYTIDLDPNWWGGHFWLGMAYLKFGRNEEAISELEKSVELSNRSSASIALLGDAYAIKGERSEALAILKELEGKYAKHEATGMHIASVYAGLGDKGQTFAWLGKALRDRTLYFPGSHGIRRLRRYATTRDSRILSAKRGWRSNAGYSDNKSEMI